MIRRYNLSTPTLQTDKRFRTKKGEMHEAFNIGLDPSIDTYETGENSEAKEGELVHSENIWPKEEDWPGADAFVSGCPARQNMADRS